MSDTEKHLDLPLSLERAAANAEGQTIPVSFASDRIIDDPWLGPVRLSMDRDAVDLSAALERGIPVRLMHERGLPLARVEQVSNDGTRLRGIMRFSSSDAGRALYRDAVDGILTDLSVGAAIYAIQERDDHTVAVRWRPREVSIVDEGADDSVGLNRSKPAAAAAPTTEQSPMSDQDKAPAAADPKPATPETPTVGVDRGENAKHILELARYADQRAPELGILRMGEDYAAFDKPFPEFRAEVWRLMEARQAKQPQPAPKTEVGLSEREAQQFSIVRAAQAAVTGNWKKAGFELEVSRAIADKLGRQPQGFFVPYEVQRAMTVGEASAGGYLVGTDHRGDMFIESLRARSIAFDAGATAMTGLNGNVAIPKQTADATFGWRSENEGAVLSDLGFGMVNMTPRTLSGGVRMSRRLLMQSSPDVETLVRNDMTLGAALAIDLAVFEGAGADGEPLGLVNHPDINTVAVSTDTTPTWDEVVQFESAVATDNALAGALKYVTTPAVRGKMKVTTKDSGSGLFVCSENNTVNGYPVLTSTQLATSRLLFGDFSQIVVGMWGVLDIKPDDKTYAAQGGLVLWVFQDVDIAVRHAQAFAMGT